MKLFLVIIGVFITSTVCLFSAEAGMPQLDPKYWASQAFWLIVIFTALYLVLSNLFIPKIKESLDNRENKIKDDLDEAQKLNEKAEQKLKEYKVVIENSKKEVQRILLENKNELKIEIENKKKIFEKEIDVEIKNTEKEIEKFKKESLVSITGISEEMTLKIVEKISGEPINQSSVKAAVLESAKKTLGKYI